MCRREKALTRGLLVRMHAKHGKEEAVEAFLHSALPMVQDEPNTMAWFAVRFGRGEYGIFDVFPGTEDRFMHLVGQVPRELAKHAFSLLGSVPEIDMLNVQAEKIGHH